jgi:hypothetical protein
MSVCSAINRPSRVAFHGRTRIRFEHNGIAGGQRRAKLVEDDLDRKVGRGDRGDDADRFLDDGSHVALAEQSATVQCPFPLEIVDQPGGITQRLRHRPVELGGLRRHHRAADLGDQLRAQVFLLGLDRRLQLF